MSLEKQLAEKLGLKNDPVILGFAIEKFTADDSHQSLGYIQGFKFKMDVAKPDANMLGYSCLKSPTLKTKLQTYCFDEDTARLILNMLDWHGQSARMCYVLKYQLRTADQIQLVPIDILKDNPEPEHE